MKTLSRFIVLVLFCSHIQAQSHLEIGTKWTYSFSNFGFLEPSYLEIVNDTVIDGTQWFVIKGDPSCASTSGNYPLIRESDSQCIIFNLETQKKSTLYDFGLQAGESYFIEYGIMDSLKITIDSTSVLDINGQLYPVQYINQVDFGIQVIGGVGTRFLFQQGNICDPQTGPLRCFENSTIFLDFDLDIECDAVYFPTNVDDFNSHSIVVYPNPTQGSQKLFVKTEKKIETVQLIGIDGKSIELNVEQDAIDLSDLKSGMYILNFVIEDQNVNKKIIIAF